MNKKVIWNTIPYTNGFYQISDSGIVRKVNSNMKKFSPACFSDSKYQNIEPIVKVQRYLGRDIFFPAISYKSDFGREIKAVSTLMYEAFHGIYNLDKNNIMHSDGDEYNNALNNLSLTLPEINPPRKFENTLGANDSSGPLNITVRNENRRSLNRYLISEYSLKGTLLVVHKNFSKAWAAHRFKRSELLQALSGIKSNRLEDRIFKYGNGPSFIDVHLLQNEININPAVFSCRTPKLVYKYSKEGGLQRIYKNYVEACLDNDVDLDQLLHSASHGQLLRNSIWLIE